jgi:hypothetical protein
MGALRQDGLADETVGRNITLTLTLTPESSRQLSVAGSHGDFLVEEELEVGL